jgi:hypothetical protein
MKADGGDQGGCEVVEKDWGIESVFFLFLEKKKEKKKKKEVLFPKATS